MLHVDRQKHAVPTSTILAVLVLDKPSRDQNRGDSADKRDRVHDVHGMTDRPGPRDVVLAMKVHLAIHVDHAMKVQLAMNDDHAMHAHVAMHVHLT